MFRVIIAGSRDFNAKGADTCEERYAKEHGYNIRYFQADWDRYGALQVRSVMRKWHSMQMLWLRSGMEKALGPKV
ncbi:MAG: DUF2493 domain-containing protein [Eubacterium sp.]|nr:DUF2493 domain-containing protein [Eubacterium sp.]